MANLLFLVHRMPYPLYKGDKVRSFHLLRHLQRKHRVFLGTFVDDPADEGFVTELQALCPDLFVARLPRHQSLAGTFFSLMRGEPMTLGYYREKSLRAWVGAVTAAYKIDATLVFCSSMAQYAPPGVPMLVDFVDLDSAKWGRYAAVRPAPISWIFKRESRVLLDYERRLAQSARGAFFVTENELAAFESAAPDCKGHAQVLRNGVDADYFAPDAGRPSPFPADELPVVFTGSMDYWPNVDAVVWFVDEMLPMLKARWPSLRFYVVGRHPSRAVRELASETVVITGTVSDVRPYLQHAAAVVAPMRHARGIQNKILEAMAMAQTVVATSACVDAVGASEAQGLLRASDAKGIVEMVGRQLHRAVDEARAMGQAARQFVLSRCEWESNLRPLDVCLAPLLSEGEVLC